jgi:hypothetical protein
MLQRRGKVRRPLLGEIVLALQTEEFQCPLVAVKEGSLFRSKCNGVVGAFKSGPELLFLLLRRLQVMPGSGCSPFQFPNSPFKLFVFTLHFLIIHRSHLKIRIRDSFLTYSLIVSCTFSGV